jgi:predicted NAD/FAD-dependent oxidoreductase
MVALQHARATSRFTDRTGKLRGSIAMGRTDTGRYGARYIVGAKPKYALFVEAGTKAHIIEPRRKSVLRFKVAGQWVAAKKVNHPGTRARKFMYEASEAGGRAVIAYLNRVLR